MTAETFAQDRCYPYHHAYLDIVLTARVRKVYARRVSFDLLHSDGTVAYANRSATATQLADAVARAEASS